MKTLVAYVPVLHEGYRRFFEKHAGPKELYIFGPDITAQFPVLGKEIRELEPGLMQKAVQSLDIFQEVRVLDEQKAHELDAPGKQIILPDEDVSRELAQKYFPKANLTFDPIFLRWDKHNSVKERPVSGVLSITSEDLHRKFIQLAEMEAGKSSDIWRHVGAVLVKDGTPVLTAHNAHLPSPHTPYVNGDPRNNFHKGDHIEISTGFHAEASLIAEAARRGIPLEGADLYVTVFPCPPCAKLIAYSGVKNLYCGGGYGVLDGEDILKGRGVAIIYVD